MRILVDATTAIALGGVGELELLAVFDATPEIPPAVIAEVTTEPAATALERFLETDLCVRSAAVEDAYLEQSMAVLDERTRNGDVRLLADVLAATDDGRPIGVVSDDRRVRTVTRGFGATVTGTIGVIVRAVEDGYALSDARSLVHRLDANGLHMTGELRVRADELLEAAARE
ncbi:hypothetical protein [Natronobiforma cellulositropha]|uniref:hypothetical protein n=1 Tax=Natronobiforma cellulositropha TaxID=1679076 RepID=UPI0021D5719E|nr:hypothetical protein [Natronobiforma cellulositropha]